MKFHKKKIIKINGVKNKKIIIKLETVRKMGKKDIFS
jgi:hypothetical protein